LAGAAAAQGAILYALHLLASGRDVPALRHRERSAAAPASGRRFRGSPHLIFYAEKPEQSGLRLFDPEGRESSPADLITDTTVWWTAEWLTYYELWHMTGTWLAPGVGYESMARLMQAEAEAVKAVLADVH
jgi:hypothetical protein